MTSMRTGPVFVAKLFDDGCGDVPELLLFLTADVPLGSRAVCALCELVL